MTRLCYPGRDEKSYFLACAEKGVVFRDETIQGIARKIHSVRALGLLHSFYVGTVEAFDFEVIRAERNALNIQDLSDFWDAYHKK